MKVLLVTPFINVSGGGVAEVVKLVDAAVRAQGGVETEVWAFDTGDPSHAVTAPIRLFRMLPPRRFGLSPALFFALLRSKADVVHVHGIWMFHVAAVYFATLVTGKPYVVTPHGMLEPWILRRSPKLKVVVSALFQNAFLRRARTVQALTPSEVDDIERFLPGTRTMLIPNYVSWQGPAEDRPPGWWKPEFAGKDVFLFLARINVKKGYRELLAAWDQACRDDAGFRDCSVLVFCGWLDGVDDFAQRIDAAASAHGNVVYGGAQYGDDKTRSLAAADFVVLPSHSEGLPMTVLEAWAAGKPVLMTQACNLPIGFRAGAARELVLDRVPFAAGLRAAGALSAEARLEMGAKARHLADAQFSRETVARALTEMYRAAIRPEGI